MKSEITPQMDDAASKAKIRRLRYFQLALISPSIVIVALLALDWFGISDLVSKVFNLFGVPHFFAMERIFGWIGRAVFYASPILFLYNLVVYLKLARRLNQDKSWIETVMMAIVIIASCLLFLAVVFLIMALRGGDIMPVPAG
jgi:hypothetical protein